MLAQFNLPLKLEKKGVVSDCIDHKNFYETFSKHLGRTAIQRTVHVWCVQFGEFGHTKTSLVLSPESR